jgi:hypothetical protein
MQQSMLIQRLCRMMPVLVVEFRADDSVPPVISAKTVISAVDSVTSSSVTVTNSTDGFLISWAAGMLPTANRRPRACVDASTTGATSTAVSAMQGAHSVEIFPAAGARTDGGGYTVEIFGE